MKLEHDSFRTTIFYGSGKLRARILYVEDGRAHMIRWNEGSKRTVPFVLSLKFLSSPSCGWNVKRGKEGA